MNKFKSLPITRAPGPNLRRHTMSTELIKKMLLSCLSMVNEYERAKANPAPTENKNQTVQAAVNLDQPIQPKKVAAELDLDSLLSNI